MQMEERNYFLSNFGVMMQMASIIGGFAFSGLLISTYYTGWDRFEPNRSGYLHNSVVIAAIYYTFAAGAVGSCLSVCMISLSVTVRAGGLSLRGADGALKRSVDAMRRWQRVAFYLLATGVVCFHLEGLCYAWLMINTKPSQVVFTVVFGLFLFGLVGIFVMAFITFRIEGEMVYGMLDADQFSNVHSALSGDDKKAAKNDYGATPRRHDAAGRPLSASKDYEALPGEEVSPAAGGFFSRFTGGSPAVQPAPEAKEEPAPSLLEKVGSSVGLV